MIECIFIVALIRWLNFINLRARHCAAETHKESLVKLVAIPVSVYHIPGADRCALNVAAIVSAYCPHARMTWTL